METTSDCMPKEENGLSISNSAFYIYSSFYTINVKKYYIYTKGILPKNTEKYI